MKSGIAVLSCDVGVCTIQVVDLYDQQDVLEREQNCSVHVNGWRGNEVDTVHTTMVAANGSLATVRSGRGGIITFEHMELRGPVNLIYPVEITCPGHEPLSTRIKIALCKRGMQLKGERVCVECPVGTYSTDGHACLPCPDGAQCNRTHTRHEDGVVVEYGVARPVTVQQRWMFTPRKSLLESYSCDPLVAEALDCVPTQGNCTWHLEDKNKLYTCIEQAELYICPIRGACISNMTRYNTSRFPNDLDRNEYKACQDGYGGVRCLLCHHGYRRLATGGCARCTPDQLESNGYIIRTVLGGFFAMLLLCLYLVFGMKLLVWAVEESCRRVTATCRMRCGCGIKNDYNPIEERCADFCSARCMMRKRGPGERRSRDPRVYAKHCCFLTCCGSDRGHPSCCHARWGCYYWWGRVYEAVRKYLLEDLRLEKFRILIAHIQILAALRFVFHLVWPPETLEFMSFFDVFLLDLFSLGSLDCWTSISYYHGLALVLAWPAIWYVAQSCIHPRRVSDCVGTVPQVCFSFRILPDHANLQVQCIP